VKVFYLHGFNSGAKADHPRVGLLEDDDYEVEVVNYDTSMLHAELAAWFDEFFAARKVDERSDTGIIGTSLGGYWSAYLGYKYQQLWIAINPAIEPSKSLKNHQ
jgi:predicted esterase YcpF (UPF0227 family)